jgi:hypothetical protein
MARKSLQRRCLVLGEEAQTEQGGLLESARRA